MASVMSVTDIGARARRHVIVPRERGRGARPIAHADHADEHPQLSKQWWPHDKGDQPSERDGDGVPHRRPPVVSRRCDTHRRSRRAPRWAPSPAGGRRSRCRPMTGCDGPIARCPPLPGAPRARQHLAGYGVRERTPRVDVPLDEPVVANLTVGGAPHGRSAQIDVGELMPVDHEARSVSRRRSTSRNCAIMPPTANTR